MSNESQELSAKASDQQEVKENKETNSEPAKAKNTEKPKQTIPPRSTTIRPRPVNTRAGQVRRPVSANAAPPKKFSVELAMGIVLGALLLGIIIVLVATSAGSATKSQPTATLAPDRGLTPKNDATITAAVATVNAVTAVPLAPTPAGTPLGSQSDSGGANWTMAGGNTARTRTSPVKLTFPLKKVWDVQTGGELISSPAIAGDSAFFGSSNGNFYAVDLKSGQIKWSRKLGPVSVSPAVAGNSVFFGTTSGFVYALDTATGADKWSFPTIEGVVSSPVVANGVVYVGSNLGILWAIDANLGKKRWFIQVGNAQAAGIGTAPAIVENIIYFGSNNGYLYAYDISGAEPVKKWITETDGLKPLLSSPAVADGTVYFATETGKLHAYDAKTGTKKWAAELEGPSASSPAVSNGVVYIGANSKKVFAFDAKDGTKKWEFAAEGVITGSPTIASDTVLIGASDTRLYALDAASGTKKWEFATEDIVVSSPAVVSGRVYLTSLDGRLYAFGE